MKGMNTLRLNEETIVTAVQQFIDSLTLKTLGKVTGVKYLNPGYSGDVGVFEVSLDTPAEGSVEKST